QSPRCVARCRFHHPASPSLRRVLAARVPRPHRYYETLRLLLPRLTGLIAFVRRYRRCVLSFAPSSRRRSVQRARGLAVRCHPRPLKDHDGEGRPPRFLGSPVESAPGSGTPAGPAAKTRKASRRGPRWVEGGGSPRGKFRGSIARHALALSTLRQDGRP